MNTVIELPDHDFVYLYISNNTGDGMDAVAFNF